MGNQKNRQKRIGKPGRRKRLTQQLVDYWTRRKEEVNNPRPPEAKPAPASSKISDLKNNKIDTNIQPDGEILEYVKLCDNAQHTSRLEGETEREKVGGEVTVDSCDTKPARKRQRSRKMSNPRRRIHPQVNILKQLLKEEPDGIIIKEEITDSE